MMDRLLVLFAAVCFGTTGTAQALGPRVSPLAVGAARIAIGDGLLVLVAGLARRRAPARSTLTWPRAEVAAAAVLVAVFQLAFFAAIRQTGVAIGTVVAIGSGPCVAGGLGALFAGDRLTARWAASTAVAVAGIVLLALAGGGAHVEAGGVALALVAGAGYGGYTVAAKRLLLLGHAPWDVMARVFGLAGLLLLPMLALTSSAPLASASGICLALYLGAIPTCLAYLCFARGLQTLGAGDTARLVLAEPLTATVLGAVVLAENLGVQAIAGVVLIILGLLVPTLPAAHEGPVPFIRAGADAVAPLGAQQRAAT